jgi:hypothetical protein
MSISRSVLVFVALLPLAALFAPACGDDGGTGSAGDGGSNGSTTSSSGTASTSGGDGGQGSASTSTGTGGDGGSPPVENPTATITSPADGDTFQANTPIPFTGTASDQQDGNLTGTDLVWTGDIVNPEGVGIEGAASFDTPGEHTLTLTATDSDGNTGSDTITLNIR